MTSAEAAGGTDHEATAQRRRRNIEAVERAFGAVSRGDVDAQMAEYDDDAVMEFPFSPSPSTLEGKAAITQMLRHALAILEMQLHITQVYECVDPDVVVIEFTSDGRVTTTDKPYANRYINVFRFADGKIRHQREYLDPRPVAEALGGPE